MCLQLGPVYGQEARYGLVGEAPVVHWIKSWQYGLYHGKKPSGKRLQKTMENHHFSWINPLFLWPISMGC